MKGDFTRSTFNPKKHYSGVRMQQGRVQLDADWNEQVDIESYRDQTTTADVVGPSGVPVLADGSSSGFQIQLPGGDPTSETMNIRQGRIYVDGVLCENDADVLYTDQADYLNPAGPADGLNIVYLDVWKQHISAVDDPGIQEVALGGPDTGTRTKTVWQVKYLNVDSTPGLTCKTVYPEWDALIAMPTGKLNVHTAPDPSSASSDPCIVPPAAGYRGLENQFYRVEIHKISGTTLTYKWSRDNGAFVFAVEALTTGVNPTVTVASLGRDLNSGLRVNDWIEIRDRAGELAATPGTLAKITDIDTVDRILTLQLESGGSLAGFDATTGHVTVRRWDCTGSAPPTVTISGNVATAWLPIEHGIEVKFVPDSATLATAYKSGDYWMFPARTATQDVEWPVDVSSAPVAQFADGIKHHYCRLAQASFDDGAWDRASLKDCRVTFLPLAGLPTIAFHFVGGDGQEAVPGGVLPRALQVAVTERGHRVAGAHVKFKVKLGAGRVKTTRTVGGVSTDYTGTEVIAETDNEGVASALFTLDNITQSQQVEAVLLDELDIPVNLNPVRFDASFASSGTIFTYVSGDGQESLPGGALPRPLQVGVNDMGQAQAGSHVRFRVVGGAGTLTTKKLVNGVLTTFTGSEVIALTGSDGVASATWVLDGSTPSQQVESRLLDSGDQLRNVTPVYFNATINSQREFLYVSGDGQEVLPGGAVPMPLQVGVMDGAAKVQGAKVKFSIKTGTGTLNASGATSTTSLTVETGADGVASCGWTLDTLNAVEQVEANLLDDGGALLNFIPIRFNATHSLAKNIGYTAPTGCDKFSGATTVREALDQLCACDCGPSCPPVIRVTGIFLGDPAVDVGPPLNPHVVMTLDTLRNGLRIKTDTTVDDQAVKSTTVYAEADMPYPLGTDERLQWGLEPTVSVGMPMTGQTVGTKPVVILADSTVDLNDPTIIKWVPNTEMMDRLDHFFTETMTHDSDTLPVKFYIKGPSIWAEGDTTKVLAGHMQYAGNIPQFPSGDDCERGSDFIFYFTIVKNPPVDDPCQKITAVTFVEPVITGSPVTGTIYLDSDVITITGGRTFRVLSDSNSVISSDQLVTVSDGRQATFTLNTSQNPVTVVTPVHLTFVPEDPNDTCIQNIVATVNVNPVPCDQILSISMQDTVTGSQIHGVITYVKNGAASHSLTVTTDNNRIPGGQTINVASTSSNQVMFTLATAATPTTPVTTPTVITTHITDPCGNVFTVPVTIMPKPCEQIKKITVDPVIGGNPAHVTVEFYEAVKTARTIVFTSPNSEVISSGSVPVPVNNGSTPSVVQFYLDTHIVTSDTTITLVVNDCNQTIQVPVVIQKQPCEDVAYYAFNASPIGGSPITGQIGLASVPPTTRRIYFSVPAEQANIIPANQYVDITPQNGISHVNFSLTSNAVSAPTNVAVTVDPCGHPHVQFIQVLPVPCEPPTEIVFDKNPIVNGTTQTGYIQLESQSISSNKPVTIKCSDPNFMNDIVLQVASGLSAVPFSFTVPNVAQTKDYQFKAVRDCGETSWVTLTVQHPSADRPRIKSVQITSQTSSYTVPFVTPGDPPLVNLANFAQQASNYVVQVKATLCDLGVDSITVNKSTFQVFYLGDTLNGQATQLMNGVDVTYDVNMRTMTCSIPSYLMQQNAYYRVVLKGTGTGAVLSASGVGLAGAFDRPLNNTNCTGGDTASNFSAEFRAVFSGGPVT